MIKAMAIVMLVMSMLGVCQANRLDEIIQATTHVKYGPLVSSYSSNGVIVIMQMNPRMWNSLDKPGQLQVCDMLAGTDFLDQMGLGGALLRVSNTTVGKIMPRMSGGYEFRPDKRYWQYR